MQMLNRISSSHHLCVTKSTNVKPIFLTHGPVDAVDPLDVPGHHLDAGLLTAAHLLVKQVISLEIQHAGCLPLVVIISTGTFAFHHSTLTLDPLAHSEDAIVEMLAFWKTFDFVTLTIVMVPVTVTVGPGPHPPLSGLEKELVRLARMLEHSVKSPEARMIDIIGRIYHSREIGATRKISETKFK